MLKDFFKINAPFDKFDESAFLAAIRTSKHICNVLYEPDVLENTKITGIVFENVSLSKTTIRKVTFNECKFIDCLFIGSEFESVEFHGCSFKNCNFYKVKLSEVYADPEQFREAIKDRTYSNIAVHLYHQLRENYYHDSQREFKNEAEYFFAHWKRRNDLVQSKRRKVPLLQYGPKYLASLLYGYLLGYGYRVRNVVITTAVMLLALLCLNYWCADLLFTAPQEPSVVKTVYFTLTTMATLGASGYSPDTEVGYMFVIGNVIFGISVFSATVSAVFKKVLR